MDIGREVSFNVLKCFSAFVKISPCGKLKNFKTNKAVLAIVIGLKNILCWNLLGSFNGGLLLTIRKRNREREREKERKTQGPKLWWSKGPLMIFL